MVGRVLPSCPANAAIVPGKDPHLLPRVLDLSVDGGRVPGALVVRRRQHAVPRPRRRGRLRRFLGRRRWFLSRRRRCGCRDSGADGDLLLLVLALDLPDVRRRRLLLLLPVQLHVLVFAAKVEVAF